MGSEWGVNGGVVDSDQESRDFYGQSRDFYGQSPRQGRKTTFLPSKSGQMPLTLTIEVVAFMIRARAKVGSEWGVCGE